MESGFAVLGMVIANDLGGIDWVPAALKHAPDIGLTAADFVARYLEILGFFVLPGIPAAQAPVWLAALQLIFLLGALMAVACDYIKESFS